MIALSENADLLPDVLERLWVIDADDLDGNRLAALELPGLEDGTV